MSAPHFFVDLEGHIRFEPGEHIALSPEDSRHALRALRLRDGARITVSNNAGAVGSGVLVSGQGMSAAVEIETIEEFGEPRPGLGVAMASPKGDRLSWATQKLAELGIDQLMLLRTHRTIRRSTDDPRSHLIRQQAIARQARMQSRQPFLMDISDRSFDELVIMEGPSLNLLLWEGSRRPISTAYEESPLSIVLVVGPEGGFSEDEVATARDHGFVDVSLGRSTLRTETAAVVGAALVLARYGRLG